MAQVDTGLGWSAISNYLRNQAPLYMGAVTSGGAFDPELPIVWSSGGNPSVAAVMAGGLAIGTVTEDGVDYTAYVGVNRSKCGIVFYSTNNIIHAVVVIKPEDYDTGSLRTWAAWSSLPVSKGATASAPSTDSVTGLQYSDMSFWEIVPNSSYTVYSSRREALDAAMGTARNCYKLNPGYAVCGMAKWIDTEGYTAVSPIIISSDPNIAHLSENGLDVSASETVFGSRWQNATFYTALFGGLSGNIQNETVPTIDLTANFPQGISAAYLFQAVATVANITVISVPDPYGDDAEPGGGVGSPDDEDDVDFSATPSVGTALGFFRMWNPSEAELRSLASWMWSSAFDLDTFKRIFSAPIDAILGLSLVPVQPSTIGGYTIVLGGVDTRISAFTVTNRYVTLDCGSLSVDERWGAYLDYAPYTKMSIFLPYIGFRDISTDDVMGKTVALQYNVDVLSGACVAELKCGGTVLYSWQGNCAQQLPITSQDWSAALSAALGLAGSAAAAIVSGGSSLPLAGTVASATVNALSLKPRMERGGSISGAAGAMAGQVPYLVRERPEQAVPGRQNHFIGYPSFTTVQLGSIAGYTEVESIHLEGIPATAAELDELENILKEGFIL